MGTTTTSKFRVLAVAALLAGGVITVGVLGVVGSGSSVARSSLAGVPRAVCGPGDRPESGMQGRVPSADYASGRAQRGYTCNAVQVGHTGSSGAFKVQRYVDTTGRVCAYYDLAAIIGTAANENGLNIGVAAVDMTDPAHPVQTATLLSPAMLNPHESVLVNQKRGLLIGILGTAATAPGIMDVYDVSADCRHPVLRSTGIAPVLGHESGFSPDGKTVWASGTAGFTLTAIDVSNPSLPVPLSLSFPGVYHGLRLSDDGRTMYVANMGNPSGNSILDRPSMRILDVSDIQDRKPNPQIRTLGEVTWSEASMPQVAEPFTRDGRTYVLEVDEFNDWFGDNWKIDFQANQVGAARIIDVTDPTKPYVVSRLRLEVHDPANRTGDVMADPGANGVLKSYAAHYCSVPTRNEPRLAGCSMIASGLRIFDISDLSHPREVAYFNQPGSDGADALSQPAWDLQRGQVWYSDGEEGLFTVKLTGRAGALLKPGACAADRRIPTLDSDGDGLSDAAEARGTRLAQRVGRLGRPGRAIGLVRTHACLADTDRDGLSDAQEIAGTRIRVRTSGGSKVILRRTDPTKADTDRDGRTDGFEVRHHRDPTRR